MLKMLTGGRDSDVEGPAPWRGSPTLQLLGGEDRTNVEPGIHQQVGDKLLRLRAA
jgi:hypothetical protein